MSKLVKAKVYLEGIQVPFTRVQIVERENAPPTCSINFSTNDRFLNLLPKTVCHVFYYHNGAYRLIYTGELTSVGFQKTTGSRSVNANFVGFTTNWRDFVMGVAGFGGENRREMTDFYLIRGLPEVPSSKNEDLFFQKAEAQNLDKDEQPHGGESSVPDYVAQGWHFTKRAQKNSFFDLVYNKLLDLAITREYDSDGNEILGPYNYTVPNLLEALFRNLNDFVVSSNPYYNILNKRSKLWERVYTIKNSNADEIFTRLITFNNSPFRGHLRSLAGVNSFSTVLQGILDYFLYSIAEIGAPISYENGNKFKNIILKPDLSYALPIKCNVIYPDDISTLSFSRNFENEPTRMSATLAPQILKRGTDPAIADFMFMVPKIWVDEEIKPNIWLEEEYFEYKSIGAWAAHFPQEESKTVSYPAAGLSYRELLSGMRAVKTGYPSSVELAFVGAVFPTDPEGNQDDFFFVEAEGVHSPFLDKLNKKGKSKEEYHERGLLSTEEIEEYMVKVLEARFYNAKFSARRAAVSTSYNPNRLVGFPSLVIGEEKLSSLVGLVTGITSTIDANGNATQDLTLDKVRIIDEQTELDTTYESRALRDLLPHFDYFYDSSYMPAKIGTELYNEIMAYDDSDKDGSIYEFATPGITNSSYLGVSNITYSAILHLKAILKNSNDRERRQFININTSRNIPSESETWKFLGADSAVSLDHENNTHSIKDLAGKEFEESELWDAIIDDPEGKGTRKLFVKERQEVVQEIMISNNVELG